ncbi:linear amide C-N hydrolase [Candidatus Thorarchaeota archaeon]|nr:MAG: linear amide C-N hydrolase [Candidatus Thorarchaeota archaeon]
MHELTLKGTYSEMGTQLGLLMKKNKYTPPPVKDERYEMAKGCERALEKYAPTLLEEIDAMVKAGGYEDTTLKVFQLALNPYPTNGCSIFAVTGEYTTTGNVIFARNYDWDWNGLEHFTLFKTYPKDALASLGYCDLMVGRYGGINEAGLAIGLTAIPAFPADYPGVMLHLATQWILDNCSNVKDAVDYMRKIPHVRANNYLVADSEGEAACIQAAPKCVEVVEPVNGLVVATNHFQTTKMQAFEVREKIPESSVPRLEHINKWFNKRKGKIDQVQAQSELKGMIASGAGVCQDLVKDNARFSTILSWTHELGTREIELTDGIPSEVDYKKYTF